MKILLITLPRTGSTSLLKQISTERGLNSISEPFNEVDNNIEKYKKFNWKFTNNICVKTHINHREIPFYLDFVKFFDEVILLSRKDLIACAESLSYANHFKNFDSQYVWVNTPNIKYNIELIKKFDKKLLELSKMINTNIIYYEDIFDVNSSNRLRIVNQI
jgi:hypothetical protein